MYVVEEAVTVESNLLPCISLPNITTSHDLVLRGESDSVLLPVERRGWLTCNQSIITYSCID